MGFFSATYFGPSSGGGSGGIVDVSGQINGPIIIGDDYVGDGSFSWEFDLPDGVTVGVATCFFGGKKRGDKSQKWLVEGTIAISGGVLTMTFPLESEDTIDLEPGDYFWSVELVKDDGTKITKFSSGRFDGRVELLEKQTIAQAV